MIVPMPSIRDLSPQQRSHIMDLFLGHPNVHLFAYDTTGMIFLSEGCGLTARGLRPGELVGKSVFELSHDTPVNFESHRRAISGETFIAFGAIGGASMECHFMPMKNLDGNVTEVWAMSVNVTDRERHAREKDFLIKASKSLSESLDYETTLDKVARLSVEVIADYCIVDLVSEDGNLRQVAAAHTEPHKEDLAVELQRRYIKHRDPEYGTYKVLLSGKSVIYPDITDEMLVANAADADELSLFRRLRPISCIISPLISRGKTLGTVSFGRSDSGLHYNEKDIYLAEEVARRAATAVDNALLYQAAIAAQRKTT